MYERSRGNGVPSQKEEAEMRRGGQLGVRERGGRSQKSGGTCE